MAQDEPKLRKLIEIPPAAKNPPAWEIPEFIQALIDPMGIPTDAGAITTVAALLGALGPKLPKVGKMLPSKRKPSAMPPNVQKLDLPDFTAVGEEPIRVRPHFRDPMEVGFERVKKQGGRLNSPSSPKKPDGK